MTQRQTEEAIVTAVDQVRALLDAQTRYIREQQATGLPMREMRMLTELRSRLRSARDYSELTRRHLMERLDPYDDIYAVQPAEPVELTPGGIIPATTGFSSYNDNTTLQDVPANTLVTVLNNKEVVNETQKPRDIRTYLENSRLQVPEGDAVAIRATAVVTPYDPEDIASMVTVGLSINQTTIIFPQTFPLNGYATPSTIAFSTTAFSGGLWAAEGASLVLRADGPVRISARSLLVARLHKAHL